MPARPHARTAAGLAARWWALAGGFSDLDGLGNMRMELRKTFQFEAAHLLPHLPKTHKCRRLHGHSFQVEIVVVGECDAALGWVMDYADITAAFKPIFDRLAHHYLKQVAGLGKPTTAK